jgi:DNA-binding response OmpR family regulator
VRGLEAGGDDYLAKPVHLREFLLRVDAMLRRRMWGVAGGGNCRDFVVRFGDNEADLDTFRARAWDGVEHLLTRREARLLGLLARRRAQVVSREEIVDELWGHAALPSTRAVDRYVDSLRHRFEVDPHAPRHFLTVDGIGFRFEPATSAGGADT